MNLLKKAKDNIFFSVLALAYIIVFMVRPDMGVSSLKNSAYYIKEMLMIMPVIFVLTALLDTWVSKENIAKYLGKESNRKGVALSFVLGSLSAGPIYAAFPLCVMLHKKGASIRNLVIILSAWAVIKVPMLLNEVKFLGANFMLVRWVLTILSILIFSWITAKIVKDGDLPQKLETKRGVSINKKACVGCTICTQEYPELFRMHQKKATVTPLSSSIDIEQLQQTMRSCPVNAINYIA